MYLSGVAVFAARLGAGLLLGARLRRRAQRLSAEDRELDVRVSTHVQGPVSFGSTVILPTCSCHWDAGTLRAVLAHEREHIRNQDGYRLWLASLCRAIFWFNPLVHLVYRRLTVLTELTSDAAAVVVIGDRSAYVNVLLQVASATSSLQEAAVPMAMRSTLPQRMLLLRAPHELSVGLPGARRALLGGVVLILGALIAACAAKPEVLTGDAVASALRVRQAPSIAELRTLYPPMLRRQHIQGMVLVRITIDATGRVVHTSIVKENPRGVGLGPAAQSVARQFLFDNLLHRSVITTLPVKFALPNQRSASPAAAHAPGA